MQIRANIKAVNHWFLMLFIVLIFLYFIGYVLGLGTIQDKEVVVNQKVTLLPFFFGATLVQHIRKKISFPHFWGIFLILNFSISAEK